MCAPIPKVASAHGAETSMNGKMFPPVSQAASLWGPAPHGTGSCKARNPHRQTTQPTASEDKVLYQGGLSPARQDLPIYVCMVLRGHQAERRDIPRLGSEGSAGRGKTAQGSPLYLQPNSPSNFTTPIFTNPIRPASSEKKEADESPAQPIDLEAKFQDLAKT
ncbi:hypothetical protein HPB52_005833 [Rhipicephalus sanguineus]|uniref:Uncharacterized protein n=1 Tax=Rhipicephalus sanguineus TaxID=34632 RepID=A0A9D4T187_RHISA|nr:hypothetical protein HPB52_005833 [Rhipicephalus sanguineus]